MKRSPIASRPCAVPGCGTQLRVPPQSTENAEAAGAPASVKVELPGEAKLTWKR